MIRRTAALAAALLLITGCRDHDRDPDRWAPVPGTGNVDSMCDGPNLLYKHANVGSIAVSPNDVRCKP